MTGIEKVLSKPVSKEEERYYMRFNDLDFLYQHYRKIPYEMICCAFRYGFEKGRRCERAKHKKAASPHADQSKGLTAQNTTGNG